jgi:hypothetical protein
VAPGIVALPLTLQLYESTPLGPLYEFVEPGQTLLGVVGIVQLGRGLIRTVTLPLTAAGQEG